MQIEPIDLRLPSKVPVWLWYANGLLFVLLLSLVWTSGFLHDEVPIDEVHVASKPVVSDPPIKAASAASTPETKPQAFDWDAVLTGLEKTQAEGVAVIGFAIDASNNKMDLKLSFDTHVGLVEYIDALNFHQVKLRCRLDAADFLPTVNSGASGSAVILCN